MKRAARTSGSEKPVHRAVLPSLRPRTGRILVVNTDPYDRLQLESTLLGHGYTVVSASSFKQASSLLEEIPVDLVVTSLQLGAFNGLHLAVRSQWSDPRRVVIVTVDVDDLTVRDQAEALGVRYVVRPLENAEFLACVELALYGSHYTNLTA